jgi:hypothetical protein
LSARLSPYNITDLLAKVAGLQLSPENASRVVRLEALVHIVASLPPNPNKPAITTSRLRQVCDSSALNELSYAEDPSEQVFAEEFIFFGGSYAVLSGIAADGGYILSHLSKAIFLRRNQSLPREFRKRVYDLMLGSLCVSDHILRRAGIRRGTPPVSNLGRPIEVPGAAKLSRLQDAAKLSKKKLRELLGSHRLDVSAIAPLICDVGTVELSQYQLESGNLLWKPFVDCGDEIILAIPGMLVSAVRNVILSWAAEANIIGELGQLYNKAIWDSVVKSLDYLRSDPLPIDLPSWDHAPLSAEGLFSLDSDKLLYCILVTDPLTKFDPSAPFQMWTNHDLEEQINKRINEIETFALSLHPAPNSLFIIGLLQGAGGGGGIGFEETRYESEALLMSAADLQTLALLEGGNPLVLLNFAQARTKAHKLMHISSTSILDEFQIYRVKGYSYYVSDQKRPNVLVIAPGDGLRARIEVAHQRDFHAAQIEGATVEVTNLHSTLAIPIYVPVSDLGQKIRILIEGFPFPVWVMGPDHTDSAHSLYANIVDAVAFWLWQMQPALNGTLNDVRLNREVLVVRIDLLEADKWNKGTSPSTAGSSQLITVHPNASTASLEVSIDRAFTTALATADNHGERELMRAILLSLGQLIGPENDVIFNQKTIQTVLDTYAPLGLKKMILLNDTGAVPQLDPRGLPPYRKLQEVKINEVLDEIGEYLIDQKKIAIGPIEDSRWTEILNDVVFYCFRTIAKEIATLQGEGIHEFFILQSEAVVRESALDRLTLPTRIECFGSVERIRQQVERKIPELSHVALASRFLVEYTAAQPPQGYRPISLDLNDRLRALAHHMINFAMLSDAIHFKLQEYSVSLLPSNRLGIAGEPWRDAMRNYMRASAEEQIAAAPQKFKRFWKKAESSEGRRKLRDELDSATKEEFGHSLSEIFSLLDFLAELGSKQSSAVKRMSRSSLKHGVSERTQWDVQKIENLLNLLTMQGRASFLEPPPGYAKQDVYPWRYNRPLSYLRRPLVAVSTESGQDLLWGNRHLRESRNYLLDQLTSGRLKPSTKGLRSLNSRLRHEEGEAFNTLVADVFQQRPRLAVRARVDKISTLKELQRHLGDIDVLVGDQSRKQVFVIECKSFSTARTPYEMSQEVKEMFVGEGEKKSIVSKHFARTRWIKAHIDTVLAFLGLQPVGHWKVIPLIIVDQLLVAPFLRKSPIKVLTAEDIRRKWPNI